jgi:hypothetical protein
MWIGFLAFPFGFVATAVLARKALLEHFQLVGFALGALYLGTTAHAGAFRCPRCGKRLSRFGLFNSAIASRCLNCKIAIGTPKSACADLPPTT